MTKQILDIRDEIVKMLFTDGQKREASRLVLQYRQDNDRVMMDGTGWSRDAIKDKIAEILVGQVEPLVSPTERLPIEPNNTVGALETAKRWALVGLDDWNAVTGYVPSNTGYYFEITSLIEDAVEYGFGVANNQDLKTIRQKIKESENGLNKIKKHK